MAEKKLEDLPLAYTNRGYCDKSGAGPSATTIHISLNEKDDESGAVTSAPTIHASLSGEGIQQESAYLPAPPPELNFGPSPLVYNVPSLVFEDIYEASAEYFKGNFCYVSRLINRMKFNEITNRGVYHYKLESFVEKRESSFCTDPYRGGTVDGPENGPPPDPWDIHVLAPIPFKDYDVVKTIPHTTTVSICSRCDGVGEVTCYGCRGSGEDDCWRCDGYGLRDDDKDVDKCHRCSGSGRDRCQYCYGSAKMTCSKCDSYGKVKEYKVLVVTWKNHSLDFVTTTDNLPEDLIIKAKGTTLFAKSDRALEPIQNAPDVTVNAASVSMLQSHRSSSTSEMIIQQRHVLRGIPFTRVHYQGKERECEFYVYGNNREVYFDVYPQRSCWCTCS